MATPTEILMSEHRGIERMLTALELGAPKLEAGDGSLVPLYEQGVDFLRNFADSCHHYKEEKLLFPALAAKGVPVDNGPIGVMLDEHERGRAFIRAMADSIAAHKAGDAAALKSLASAALGYTQLLRAHIYKEDNVLFQMAGQVLTGDEQTQMAEEFDRVESEIMGEGTHERYHAMLDTLPG